VPLQAEKYADLAIRQDRYNAMALVNKGNCLFVKNEFGKAKELYLEAIGTHHRTDAKDTRNMDTSFDCTGLIGRWITQ
jgi:tetratricopeptide (TPR) repeat protein